MKFLYKVNDKFIFEDKYKMIIVDFDRKYNYFSSSEPYKNYIVEFFDENNNIIKNRCFECCLNMSNNNSYKYLINERIIACSSYLTFDTKII